VLARGSAGWCKFYRRWFELLPSCFALSLSRAGVRSAPLAILHWRADSGGWQAGSLLPLLPVGPSLAAWLAAWHACSCWCSLARSLAGCTLARTRSQWSSPLPPPLPPIVFYPSRTSYATHTSSLRSPAHQQTKNVLVVEQDPRFRAPVQVGVTSSILRWRMGESAGHRGMEIWSEDWRHMLRASRGENWRGCRGTGVGPMFARTGGRTWTRRIIGSHRKDTRTCR